MRRASIPLALGCALWFIAVSAQAFGFGRASSPTVLGQTLNFTATVRVEPDEALAPECVTAEVMMGDSRLPPQVLSVGVEPGYAAGERLVRVTSTVNIDEPIVTVTISVGCTQRISRKFVAFIDPPSVSLAQSSIVESSPVETPRAPPPASAPTLAPAASPAPAARAVAAAAPRKPEVVRRPRAPSPVAPSVVAAPASAARPRGADVAVAVPQRVPARAAGPRLQLEAAAPMPGRLASPPGSAEALANAAQRVDSTVTLLTEQSEMLAKERARLMALEESLTRLRTESQATQTSLASLQARLKAAESQRFANPLVYVLAWLAALLAVAVVALVWRQKVARRDPQWWAQQAPPPARPVPAASESAVTTPPPVLPPPAPKRAPSEPPALVDRSRPMWADSRLTEAPPEMVPEPRRDLSVEELIDLEQQAEFFVVLGQDEAAIDLLMGHVRNTGGISPLPYLKLLEIYKRRGDRSAYERIRERFNRRFNAYAPDWDADLQHGKSLEDYPGTMVKLEGLWGSPQRVMEILDAMLFRRDESEEAYDLPAYRELLFLYSVARDFTTRGTSTAPENGGVDLLLPIDDLQLTLDMHQPSAAPAPRRHDSGVTLDLDMTSPMPAGFEPTIRPRRTPAPPAATPNSDFLDLPELPTGPGRLGPRS
jgi:cell division protein ZapA (FtsZ GTPase activity inhibitor)